MTGTQDRFEMYATPLGFTSDDAAFCVIEILASDENRSVQSKSTNILPPQWERYAAVGRRVPTVSRVSTVPMSKSGPRSYTPRLTNRGTAWRSLALFQSVVVVALFLYNLFLTA